MGPQRDLRSFSNSGGYFLVISNAFGITTSSIATLTVTPAPVISQPPTNQTGVIGQPASFSVTAFGAQPLFYQWRKNSNNIAGANASVYSIPSVSFYDAGAYDVVITNSYGSVTSSIASFAAQIYNGVMAGWDFSPLAGGANNFGAATLAATTNSPYTVPAIFTRASGVGTTGTGAAHGWGGNNWTNISEAMAISSNQFVTATLVVSNGYKMAITGIGRFDYRRSGVGPISGELQYQIGNGAFIDAYPLSYTVATSGGASLGAFDLSGIAALQNISAGTAVTLRIVNWGGTSTIGAWYLYDVAASTAPDFTITGNITLLNAPAQPTYNQFLTAYDFGTNVSGGENLALTNNSGANLYVWSSPVTTVSVTNWSLIGPMTESPFGTGSSLYSITLKPTNSPAYYIFAASNTPSYTASEPVTWLTTANGSNFSVNVSNAPITANGIFNLPTPPVILTQPSGTNVFAGKNLRLATSASGPGTLTYQWFFNGGTLPGATTNFLNFTPAALSNSGYYVVTVSNLFGSTTSSVASVNIVPVPGLSLSNYPGGLLLAGDGGAANNAFVVQGTTNLAPPTVWTPLLTNVIGTNGQIRFAITNQSVPAIFYRVQFP